MPFAVVGNNGETKNRVLIRNQIFRFITETVNQVSAVETEGEEK